MSSAMSVAMPPAPDTSTTAKSLYVAVPRTILPDVMNNAVLAPRHAMASDTQRTWIPLNTSPSDALERARWEFNPLVRSQTQFYVAFILLRIDFSALGFGHYCATDVLIEEFPLPVGEGWRFHGEMQVPFEENTDGQILLQLRVLDRGDAPNIPMYSR